MVGFLGAVAAGLAYACGVVMQPTAPPLVRPAPAGWSAANLTIAYVGHASVLIDFAGTMILTDPAFFARIGPSLGPLTIGPKRVVAAALTPEELPPLDAVVVTHAHLDSLDLPSLRRVTSAPLSCCRRAPGTSSPASISAGSWSSGGASGSRLVVG